MDLQYLIKNFFTHKDFLIPADQLMGTLFTPLHFVFSAMLLAVIIVGAVMLSKRGENTIRRVFMILWIAAFILEPVKIVWESVTGNAVRLEVGGVLPLYPCSVFLYAMPFAIWGKGHVRNAACGYVCTVGMLGATVNFVYPVNVLANYSCLSFAGFHTFFYHGTMLFVCLTMLISGYHRYNIAQKWWHLFLAAIPLLIVSIPANILNYSSVGSDYMFFRGNSFFLPAILGGISDELTTVIIYALYILVPAAFYLPGYLARRKTAAPNI